MAQGGLGALLGSIVGAFSAGPASGTIEALSGKALETLLGPSLDEAKQYAEAYIETPKNHDLERSLRFAALLACLHLILEQKRLEEAEAAMERGKPRDTFCERARKWVHGQLRTLGEVQDGAHQARISAYQKSLNTALASQPDLRDATRAAEARKIAEEEMWRELVDALPDQQFPTDFEARFLGKTGHGWFGFFIIFLREALKNQDNARHAFFIGGLSDLQNAVTRIEEVQMRLEGGQTRLESKVDKLPSAQDNADAVVGEFKKHKLDSGKQRPTLLLVIPCAFLALLLVALNQFGGNGSPAIVTTGPVSITYGQDAATAARQHEEVIAAISREKGVPLPLLQVALRPLGPDNISAQEVPSEIERRVAELLELREKVREPIQGPPAVQHAREEAQRLIDSGKLAEAGAKFGEARAMVRRGREASKGIEARLAAEEAMTARANFQLKDAAALWAEAAELMAGEPALYLQYRRDQAVSLQQQGSFYNDKAALLAAVNVLENASMSVPRAAAPMTWDALHHNRGLALVMLANREGSTERLEQAIGAFRKALEGRNSDFDDDGWAWTQNQLGMALLSLGAETSSAVNLTEAVHVFSALLSSWQREKTPRGWAMTQFHLGHALQALGWQEVGTARLEDAVTAYRAALEEFTRDRAPHDWAMTQNGLGNALRALGERETTTARLEEAVTAYRAALEEWTRNSAPINWAMTQVNLGYALQALGTQEAGTARLEEAVSAFRAALEERTRNRAPANWAMTQITLGQALFALGSREASAARLEEAVTAYRAALEEWTRNGAPLNWAETHIDIGNALTALSMLGEGRARLEEAATAYRAALEGLSLELVPLEWAKTQERLGEVLLRLGARKESMARLEEAATAYRAALEEISLKRGPLNWATTQVGLGRVLLLLGALEEGTARLEDAITAHRAALEELTRDRAPKAWARTQNDLGNALSALGAREEGTARLKEAVTAYHAALEVLTRAPEPRRWASIQFSLADCLATLAERSTSPTMADAITHMQNAVDGFQQVGDKHWSSFAEKRLAELKARQK
jgi:tetratricopeptide (TPR) repeat protein